MHRAGAKTAALDNRLVERLMEPAAFDHPVTSVETIETHISWVILTDQYAYKIKKPLILDFLDFGTLERRRHFCEEELRLNRPWAGDIYLDVVPVTESGGQLRFGGPGTPVEYALRMRRFDSDQRLDRQLSLGKLTVDDMHALGEAIASRHGEAPVIGSEFRERALQMTIRLMHENFEALEGHVNPATLSSLADWTEQELKLATPLIAARFDGGFFRDCHGDLHLANLVRMPGGIRTFDCIEFNDDLRRIDVICDVAFLVMDLVSKGRRDLAAQFLNRYLEQSGDYDGVVFLDLYFVYRCLVRAKVAVICSHESELHNERLRNLEDADRYCRIALRQTWKPAPLLVVMRGLSGSGKTWVSGHLLAALPAIRLRSDIERKRQFGLPAADRSESQIGKGIYTKDATTALYQRLAAVARSILDARHNVILDGTFLLAEERDAALDMADSCGYAAVIVDVRAPWSLMQERIERRQRAARDASEADLAVLEHQRAMAEPLSGLELERTVVHDNVAGSGIEPLVDAIRVRANNVSRRPGSRVS